MNHNIIRKLKFVLSNTEANFKNAEANGDIHDYDIAFIAEPGNKDIYTHGIYMLKEIKTDIKALTGTMVALDSRITSNKTKIDEHDIALTNLTNIINRHSIDIAGLDGSLLDFRIDTKDKFEKVNDRVTAITTTAVTLKIVTALPEISSANNHTIYLVSSTDQLDNNIYTEYILQNDKWEVIGILKSELYLDQYLTKSEFLSKHDNILYSINNLYSSKANVSHNHAIEDITNFPTFKTINNESVIGSGNITILASETDLSNYYTDWQCDSKYLNINERGGKLTGGSDWLDLGRVYRGSEDDPEVMDVQIPPADTETAGLMSAEDKINLDKLSGMINHKNDYLCVDIYSDESSVTLGQTYVDMGDGTDTILQTIDAATHEKAGVMSAEDKIKLDALSSGSGNETIDVKTNVTQYTYYSIGSNPKQPDLDLPTTNLVIVDMSSNLLKEYIVPNNWSTNVVSTTDAKPYLWKVIFTCYDKYGNGTGENAAYNKILSSGAILAAVKGVGVDSNSTGADWIYEGDWQSGKIYERTSGKIPYVSYGYVIKNNSGEWVWTKDKPASDTVGYLTQYWYLSANTTETNTEPNESTSSVWIKFRTDTAITAQFLNVDLIVANKVDTTQLNAVNARIDNLEAKEIVTDQLITTDLGNEITITIKDGKITFDAGDKGRWYLGLGADGKPNWLSNKVVATKIFASLEGTHSTMYKANDMDVYALGSNAYFSPKSNARCYYFYKYTSNDAEDPDYNVNGYIFACESQYANGTSIPTGAIGKDIVVGDAFVTLANEDISSSLNRHWLSEYDTYFAEYSIAYCYEYNNQQYIDNHKVYVGFTNETNPKLKNVCLIGSTDDGITLFEVASADTNTSFANMLYTAAQDLNGTYSDRDYNNTYNIEQTSKYIGS